jgi:glucoamylase
MPLVWAHAEYVKLARSIHDGRVFDTPRQTLERYGKRCTSSPLAVWRFNHRSRAISVGQVLRIEVLAPAVVHWSIDHWRQVHDSATRNSGLGMHFVDLATDRLASESIIDFTFYWPAADRWENVNFAISVIQRL